MGKRNPEPINDVPGALSPAEMQRHYGVSSRTTNRWINSGLPSCGTRKNSSGPRSKLYDPEEVDKWLAIRDWTPKGRKPTVRVMLPENLSSDPGGLTFADQLQRARVMEHKYSELLDAAIATGEMVEQVAYRKMWIEQAEHLRKMEVAAPTVFLATGAQIKMDDVTKIFGDIGAGIKSEFLSMPNKVAPKLHGRSVKEISDILTEHITSALNRLSDQRLFR